MTAMLRLMLLGLLYRFVHQHGILGRAERALPDQGERDERAFAGRACPSGQSCRRGGRTLRTRLSRRGLR